MQSRAISRESRTIHIRVQDAEEVYVLGKFNNWSTLATPMVRVGDWLWEATVPVGADARELGFFVWELGRRFGRFLRYEEAHAAPAA